MGAWDLRLAGEGAGVATKGPGKPRVIPTATESVWPQRMVMLGVQVHGSAPRSEAERPADSSGLNYQNCWTERLPEDAIEDSAYKG